MRNKRKPSCFCRNLGGIVLKLTFCFGLSIPAAGVFAQGDVSVNPSNPLGLRRNILTHEKTWSLSQNLPGWADTCRFREWSVENFRRSGTFEQRYIPIVFHIFHSEAGSFITHDQIVSQIEALNRYFNQEVFEGQHPADEAEGFSSFAANVQIGFCLADFDPSGNPSPGYSTRTNFREWGAEEGIKDAAKGGISPWDPQRYLNIWVGKLGDTVSGYAQMPGGPPATDGIVIDQRFFGTMGTAQAPFNEGKTLVHLVGNYLGLYGLWGEYPCGDDYVSDTPIHNAPNEGCPIYKHVSLCGDYPVEMTMNFMDNTDDACMYMFTQGQKLRMHSMLAPGGLRDNLATASSCSPFIPQIQAPGILPAAQMQEISPAENLMLPNPEILLFPNPTEGSFTLRIRPSSSARTDIYVLNALGELTAHFSRDLHADTWDEMQLDGSRWASGVYWIQVVSEQQLATAKLVISKK